MRKCTYARLNSRTRVHVRAPRNGNYELTALKAASWLPRQTVRNTVVQNRKNTDKIIIQSFTVPRVRKWAKWASEQAKWVQRSTRAKQTGQSKRTNERCEQTSKRTIEWPSTFVWVFGRSGPQCATNKSWHFHFQPKEEETSTAGYKRCDFVTHRIIVYYVIWKRPYSSIENNTGLTDRRTDEHDLL